MPMYDYQCRHCRYRFELFHGISESPKPPCPECGGLTERTITTGPVIQTRSQIVPDLEASSHTDDEEVHVCHYQCALHHYHPHHPPEAGKES